MGTENERLIVTGVAANTKGVDSRGGDGPWVVVQKPRRPRKPKEGLTAGPIRNTGTGTRFEILESINDDTEIDGSNNEERIICDPPANNNPNLVHGKGRGKHVKHVEDKRGKAAENKVVREPSKQKYGTDSIIGTHAVNNNLNNIQILKRVTKEGLTRRENQGNNEISQNQSVTNDKHGTTAEDPHIIHEGVIAANNSLVGPHHMPRPPNNNHMGLDANQNTIRPISQDATPQSQRSDEEDMEIIAETPNLDQQDGGVKSMILS
jgi:hypothetical protein